MKTTSHLTLFIFGLVMLSSCAQEKLPQNNKENVQTQTGRNQLADCSVKFEHSGLCVNYVWEKLPTETEEGSFVFKTYRANAADGSPVQMDLAKTPEVLLWMPGMGHGSSPTEVSVVDVGTYRVSKVYFIMPGDWDLRFQLKTGETVDDEAIIPFTF